MKLILFFIIFSSLSTLLQAKDLRVGIGMPRPPFIFDESENGIVEVLFKNIAQKFDWSYKSVHIPNVRLQEMLLGTEFDVLIEVQIDKKSKYFFSDKFISYRNHFISNKKNIINKYSDLKNLNVCTWQNAKDNLGAEFRSASLHFKSYREFAFQKDQVLAFVNGECDALLIDDSIFHLFERSFLNTNKELAKVLKYSSDDILIKPLPGNYELWWYVGFLSKKMRDDFNTGLAKLRATGDYDHIRNTF